MPERVKSIAEHWDLLWYIVVVLIGAVNGLIWRTINRMEARQEDFIRMHSACREALPKEYVTKEELKEIKNDRADKWKGFFRHRHHPSGEVNVP